MSPTFYAPAKVNLWLRVFPRDATGYHPLDTLFCAIDLHDEITIDLAGDDITLVVTGADVGPREDNLAYRAAVEFFFATGLPRRAHIRLQKHIPARAGLGGGSSDAATVLRGLNVLHGNPLPRARVMAMAARIGSDVPFFLCGAPLAHATGRGELLAPQPALPRVPMIVVAPEFAIATGDAYRWLDEARAFADAQDVGQVRVHGWNDVARKAVNDFERVLFAKSAELARVRDEVRSSGARIALLSGSGSAVFGVYESEPDRGRAAALLSQRIRRARVIECCNLTEAPK